jgi:hypothetical protein
MGNILPVQLVVFQSNRTGNLKAVLAAGILQPRENDLEKIIYVYPFIFL